MMVLTATGSSALTLGRVQGVALIGRPLNVAVRVELDAPADAAELCLVADVFYGDTRLDRNRVTISVDAAGNGAAIAQLRSNVAVDEPVVTVYLQAGCVQKLTRRFVLLAEQPGDAPAPALRAAESVAAVPQVPTAVASRGGAPGQNSAAAGPGAGQAVGARGGVAAEPANASGRGSAARDDRRS
ncbi:MAG TPA: hypothetical protein VLJ58_17870, partial [Ramlibacter sp.]|nr:hypothetical protein [Ramlibacter sp.]